MTTIGVILLLLALVFWFVLPTFGIITGSFFGEYFFILPVALAVIGGILIFVSVSKDRYKEYKEDQEDNDYRKY